MQARLISHETTFSVGQVLELLTAWTGDYARGSNVARGNGLSTGMPITFPGTTFHEFASIRTKLSVVLWVMCL